MLKDRKRGLLRLLMSGLLVSAMIASAMATIAVQSVAADDESPYATEVVSYNGSFGNSPYDSPGAVLGKPTTDVSYWGDEFKVKLVEPAYGYDPYDNKVITTLNNGADIVVKFDHHVMNDSANPYGIDFIVFGNSFFVGNGYVNDSTNMSTYMLTNPASCFSENVTVSVSQYGETWYTFNSGPYADNLFPTQAYQWDNTSYDWTDTEMDFTKPVDPSLTLSDFNGISAASAIALYNGSGGGTGFDLADLGGDLDWIQYVRVTGYGGEIDAFADVAP